MQKCIKFIFDILGISYFLEPLLMLSLFGKANLKVLLNGITNEDSDISVNIFEKE
jgi:RNA 3'-terminal phosphate cyclase